MALNRRNNHDDVHDEPLRPADIMKARWFKSPGFSALADDLRLLPSHLYAERLEGGGEIQRDGRFAAEVWWCAAWQIGRSAGVSLVAAANCYGWKAGDPQAKRLAALISDVHVIARYADQYEKARRNRNKTMNEVQA